MQRKSNILIKERSGFAMIMAIFFMVIMSTLMMYMLGSSVETAERTTKDYVNEQAQLLAKSAVEYAILRVSGYDRTTVPDCLRTINMVFPDNTSPLYDITINISYHGLGNVCNGNGTVAAINTAESVGSMLIDVYVEDNPTLGLSEPVRYHRRTLQKL